MGFPDNLLASDERVALHMRPHWKELVWPSLVFVVLVLLGVFGYVSVSENWGAWTSYLRIGVAAVAALLVLWFAVTPWIGWISTHYVFTTHRVLLRTGIVTRSGRDIPYARVNDVSFEQTVPQRLLGLGTLIVQSASDGGAVTLKDMPRVEQVQSTLYKLVEQDRDRR